MNVSPLKARESLCCKGVFLAAEGLVLDDLFLAVAQDTPPATGRGWPLVWSKREFFPP